VFLRVGGTGDYRDGEKSNKTDRAHSHWDNLIGRRITVVMPVTNRPLWRNLPNGVRY
jgi:hypothetical protein